MPEEQSELPLNHVECDVTITRAIQQLADRGDSTAATVIGLCLAEGWGIHKDEQLATKYLSAAAKKSPVAMYLLARRLLPSAGTASEAHRLAQTAAEAGVAEAATLLGDAYKLGLGVQALEDESIKWYFRGGELGDGAAFANLAMRYVDDKGHISNTEEAKAWFERAHILGYRASTAYLAKILLEYTDPPDIERGLQLLHEGAGSNDFGSLLKLSRVYRDGLFGISPDTEKADRYHKMAKEAMSR